MCEDLNRIEVISVCVRFWICVEKPGERLWLCKIRTKNSAVNGVLTGVGCGGLSLAGDGDGQLDKSPLCRKLFFSPSLSMYRNISRFFLSCNVFSLFSFNCFFFLIYTQTLSNGVVAVKQYNVSFLDLNVAEF